MITLSLLADLFQACVCLILLVSALRWIMRNPAGADPSRELRWLVISAAGLGVVAAALNMIRFGGAQFNELTSGDPNQMIDGAIPFALASLRLLPVLALFPVVARKAMLVAILATLGFLPSVATIVILLLAMLVRM